MKAYLIGYKSDGFPPLEAERLIKSSDVCIMCDVCLPIGMILEWDGHKFRVTEHEHDGKVIVLTPIESN